MPLVVRLSLAPQCPQNTLPLNKAWLLVAMVAVCNELQELFVFLRLFLMFCALLNIACAWAGFTGYGVAMLLSYFVGQKKYPIQYDLKAIGMYVLLAAVLYVAAEYVSIDNIYLRMAYRTVLLLLFIAYVVKRDLPLNQIPILNKLLKH